MTTAIEHLPVSKIKTLVTPEKFVEVTDFGSFEETSHQCHAASLALVKSGLLGPRARVARGSAHGVGGQHSWVVIGNPYDENAVIVDPTLWSYVEDVEGIWVGTAKKSPYKHTPHGGVGTIWQAGKPYHHGGETIELTPKAALSASAQFFLDMVGPLDARGWAGLAQAPVRGWPAAEIIAAMDDTPVLRAHVPIDRLGMLTDRNPDGLYLQGEETP